MHTLCALYVGLPVFACVIFVCVAHFYLGCLLMLSIRWMCETKPSESVCGLCADCFFLVRIFKLNLGSRGTFADLSYLTMILTNINVIMLSVRRMLESNTSASETK